MQVEQHRAQPRGPRPRCAPQRFEKRHRPPARGRGVEARGHRFRAALSADAEAPSRYRCLEASRPSLPSAGRGPAASAQAASAGEKVLSRLIWARRASWRWGHSLKPRGRRHFFGVTMVPCQATRCGAGVYPVVKKKLARRASRYAALTVTSFLQLRRCLSSEQSIYAAYRWREGESLGDGSQLAKVFPVSCFGSRTAAATPPLPNPRLHGAPARTCRVERDEVSTVSSIFFARRGLPLSGSRRTSGIGERGALRYMEML